MRRSLALAIALLPATARAAPCELGVLADPVSIAFHDGAIGAPRRACPRSELALGAGGIIIAQPSEFYGNIRALAQLSGSVLLTEQLEVFGAIELARYQLVISSLNADHFGLGHTTLGAGYRVASSEDSMFGGSFRLTLPTAFGLYENAWPIAADLGASATTTFDRSFELHAHFGVVASFAFSRAGSDPRGGVVLAAGGMYRVFDPFSVVLDVDAATFYRATLDHVSLGLGLRLQPSEDLTIELLAKAPLAGDERSLVSAYLGVRWAPR